MEESTDAPQAPEPPVVEYREGGWWCAACDVTYPTASRYAWHDCPDR